MKILVVLSALAAVALAAPAKPDHGVNQLTGTQDKLLAPIKREKKSPIEDLNNLDVPREEETFPPFDRSEVEPVPETARTFHHKKPIIIKKKHGHHHVYRNSDEENADSQEKCTKEVKVKLCDAGNHENANPEKMRNAETEDSELEQSINMAKEAVENVQRCLKQDDSDGCKISKPNTESRMAQMKHFESRPDAEIHEDIEGARQALEHIQQNFGNLESMNLRATTLKDSEAVEGAHLKIAKSNEEKLAQWREAIANIQRNVEIVRNIEDSLKSEPSSDVVTQKVEKPVPLIHEPSMKSMENEMLTSASEPKQLHDNTKVTKLSSDDNQAKINKAATTKSEELSLNVQSNDLGKKAQVEQPKHGKSSELDALSHVSGALRHDNLADSQNIHKLMKASENHEILLDSEPAASMKSNADFEHNPEHDKHRAVEASERDQHLNEQKNAWIATENKNMLMKSSENNGAKLEVETSSNADTTSPMKAVDKKNDDHKKELADSTVNIDSSKGIHADLTMKPSQVVDLVAHSSQPINSVHSHVQPSETLHAHQKAAMIMKESEHPDVDHMEKSSNFLPHSHLEVASDLPFSRTHDSNIMVNEKSAHMDSATAPTMLLAHGKSAADMDSATAPSKLMAQGNSAADVDSATAPTMHTRNDVAEKSALEYNNMRQWNQHLAARGAYGSGAYGSAAGAGSSAVGVFPNANVGGCAIPLLLSCSPSVVKGSLTSHGASAYGGAAYRAGEDFKFHNKRDLKINDKIPTAKVKRTPTKILQKIPSFKAF